MPLHILLNEASKFTTQNKNGLRQSPAKTPIQLKKQTAPSAQAARPQTGRHNPRQTVGSRKEQMKPTTAAIVSAAIVSTAMIYAASRIHSGANAVSAALRYQADNAPGRYHLNLPLVFDTSNGTYFALPELVAAYRAHLDKTRAAQPQPAQNREPWEQFD